MTKAHEFWTEIGFKSITVYLPPENTVTYYECRVLSGRAMLELAKSPDTPEWKLAMIGNRRSLGTPTVGEFQVMAERETSKKLKKMLIECADLILESKKAAHVAINYAENERQMYEQGAYSYACNFTADALYKLYKEMSK